MNDFEDREMAEVYDDSDENSIHKGNKLILMEVVQTLKSASLTVQWLPDCIPSENNCSVHRLILGTHNTGDQENSLIIARVRLRHLPASFGDTSISDSEEEEEEELDGRRFVWGKISIDLKINHEGWVNRARYMPQNPCLIATKTPFSDVLVFDYTTKTPAPCPSGVCSPDLRLKGHQREGHGLSWNPNLAGHLLSASEDHTVCLWDISATPKVNRIIDAHNIFRGHTDSVEDVSWHPRNSHLFVTVGADKNLMMWDSRCGLTPMFTVRAHDAPIACLDFNPFHEYTLVTGSADKTVGLWDIRIPHLKLHSLGPKCHSDFISQVQWSPHSKDVLASSDMDGGIYIWNINKIGAVQEQDREDPPELIDLHSGPWKEIYDFNWNPNKPYVISHVSEDNILEVYHTYALRMRNLTYAFGAINRSDPEDTDRVI